MTEATSPAAPHWRYQNLRAQLCGSLSALLDLQDLAHGLQGLRTNAREIPGHVLGCRWPLAEAATLLVRRPLDVYFREGRLAAVFGPHSDAPWRVQLDWNLSRTGSEGVLAIDLTLSLQTDLWEAYPEILCQSSLPGWQPQVWRGDAAEEGPLAAADLGEGAAGEVAAVSWQAADPSLPAYVELAYPRDFTHVVRAQDSPVEAATPPQFWRFSDHFQEKGVIRRLRMRGVWTHATVDADVVRQLRQQFLGQPLPLST
jgi:hypothetical protein